MSVSFLRQISTEFYSRIGSLPVNHMKRRARQRQAVPLWQVHPRDFSKAPKVSFHGNTEGGAGRTTATVDQDPLPEPLSLVDTHCSHSRNIFVKQTCPLTSDSKLESNPCFHRASEKHLKLLNTPCILTFGYECIQEKDDLTPSPKRPENR